MIAIYFTSRHDLQVERLTRMTKRTFEESPDIIPGRKVLRGAVAATR